MKEDPPGKPLWHARRGPGRPRKHPESEEVPGSPPPLIDPRLLDLPQAARYLSVSPWTIRSLESAGVLPRVRIPLPEGRELRKLLFDRRDLDRLIDAWKDSPWGGTAARGPRGGRR
jgi:hypothetical protein